MKKCIFKIVYVFIFSTLPFSCIDSCGEDSLGLVSIRNNDFILQEEEIIGVGRDYLIVFGQFYADDNVAYNVRITNADNDILADVSGALNDNGWKPSFAQESDYDVFSLRAAESVYVECINTSSLKRDSGKVPPSIIASYGHVELDSSMASGIRTYGKHKVLDIGEAYSFRIQYPLPVDYNPN